MQTVTAILPEMVEEIARIGRCQAPKEACGILFSHPLPTYAPDPINHPTAKISLSNTLHCQILHLPNRAASHRVDGQSQPLDPNHAFCIEAADIVDLLGDYGSHAWGEASPDGQAFDRLGVVIWHVHPGDYSSSSHHNSSSQPYDSPRFIHAGTIGPSSKDLASRIAGMDYLVVTLTDDGPVAVRY